MLRRAGFIYATKDRVLDENYQGKLFRIDITDFGDVSRYHDDEVSGNSYADILVNRIGSTINHIADYMEEKHGIAPVVGRYAGDEFIFEISNPELSDELRERIQEELTTMKAYYRREDGTLDEGNVTFKHGIEEIIVPEDNDKREIFNHYYLLGLILSPEEIDRIQLHKDQVEAKGGTYNFIEHVPIYLQSNPKQSEKIFQLLQLRKDISEIEDYLVIASNADESFEEIDGMGAVPMMLDYMENIEVDPLLGGDVLQSHEFINLLQQNQISQFAVIKTVIKEPNDMLGMAVGDEYLKAVKDYLCSPHFLGDNSDDFIIGRSASDFLIGLKRGKEITADLLAAFSRFHFIDYKNQHIRVGFSMSHLDEDPRLYEANQSGSKKNVRETLECILPSILTKTFKYAEKNYYRSLWTLINSNEENRATFEEIIFP